MLMPICEAPPAAKTAPGDVQPDADVQRARQYTKRELAMVKTKTNRAGERRSVNEMSSARSRGGAGASATETTSAATKQRATGEAAVDAEEKTSRRSRTKPGETFGDTDLRNAGQAGEWHHANEVAIASHGQNGGGESCRAAEAISAPPVQSNGHAKNALPSNERLRGRKSRGSGDKRRVTDGTISSPATFNGHARNVSSTSDLERDQAGGDHVRDSEGVAAASKHNGCSSPALKPIGEMNGHAAGDSRSATDCSSACRILQELQRQRVAALESRKAIDIRLQHCVASVFGYSAGLDENDRKARFVAARALIDAIDNGDELTAEQAPLAPKVAGLVLGMKEASKVFDSHVKALERSMLAEVAKLPAFKWSEGIRGFGPMRLAIIVGEAGDLSQYANPGKLWKRLGLAPISKDGATKMPSTWRSKGGLSAEEWTTAGYSPRRRSVMYVIGELIVKLNDGEYRARYDEAKAKFQAADPERSKGHCHNHGMLCAVKRLVRDLWRVWRDGGLRCDTE